MPTPGSDLLSLARAHAGQIGARAAVRTDDQEISFAQLYHHALQTATWLHARGVRRGDRIAVWMVNRPQWLGLVFGAAALGVAVVSINTRYRAREVGHLLEVSRAMWLFLEPRFQSIDFLAVLAQATPSSLGHLRGIGVVGGPVPARSGQPLVLPFDPGTSEPLAQAAGSADDVVILFPTSGTTSGPKLVMHTQGGIVAHSRAVASAYGLANPSAVALQMLPLCGVFGFNAALAAFAAGRPIIMPPTFDAAPMVKAVLDHRITHLFGSDEMYERLLDVDARASTWGSVRVAGFASFRPGAETVARRAQGCGLPMAGVYGSSEVQALFSMQPETALPHERVLPGGRPANDDVCIRARDPANGALVGTGEPGLLEIRSASNFAGYFENPAAEQAARTDDGFFRTGDLGYICEDGRFVYQSRAGDAMRLAGYLVAPSEIEDALLAQPGVGAAQAVAVERGQSTTLVAFLIAAEGASPPDAFALQAALKARLARFKVPAHIWFLDVFPVTEGPNGTKIQKGKLREMAARRLAELER